MAVSQRLCKPTGDFARTNSQQEAFDRAKKNLLDPEYWLIRWYCKRWNLPPHRKDEIGRLSISELWVWYVEEEIVSKLSDSRSLTLESIEAGNVWATVGNSFKAIYMRMRERYPSKPTHELLSLARAEHKRHKS